MNGEVKEVRLVKRLYFWKSWHILKHIIRFGIEFEITRKV
jgi:hypothetical protein